MGSCWRIPKLRIIFWYGFLSTNRKEFVFWLVWNMAFMFPYIGNNNPNWLSYFFRGVGIPPTSFFFWGYLADWPCWLGSLVKIGTAFLRTHLEHWNKCHWRIKNWHWACNAVTLCLNVHSPRTGKATGIWAVYQWSLKRISRWYEHEWPHVLDRLSGSLSDLRAVCRTTSLPDCSENVPETRFRTSTCGGLSAGRRRSL